MVARDPETGLGNASYARLKILGPDEALIGIAPNHHLAIMARKAADRAASRSPSPSCSAPIRRSSSPPASISGWAMTRCTAPARCSASRSGWSQCRTIDLLVPAEAEIVLEGHIHADKPIVEGLVSEYHGMYEDYGTGVRASFHCMTSPRRRDVPGHRAWLSRGAHLPRRRADRREPQGSVLARVDPQCRRSRRHRCRAAGRTNVVVQIDNPRPGQARRAMAICWGAVSIVKNVTIVDADVDPWDLEAVELAKLTRMRAERDILIVTDLPADRSEPQEDGGMVTKVGYDATCKPATARKDTIRRCRRRKPMSECAPSLRAIRPETDCDADAR